MWSITNSTLGFFLTSIGILNHPDLSLVVQTPFGRIEGIQSQSRGGKTYYEFLSVPYALPPMGDLRFREPVPWNKTWSPETRDGTTDPQKCIQYHLIARHFQGDEDCLFLSVYTTKFHRAGEDPLTPQELKPVIVYVHGGMFMQGSGAFFKPKYLMDGESEIVFVALQYRVGALGFLNMESDEVPGNVGLKDQVEALRWVQRNIHHFGGDASKVTLMGESAGSASVHLHMLSPMSRGLFHRAISQSGTALNSWSVRYHPVTQALLFAQKVGCNTDNSTKEAIIGCLRDMDARKIGRAHMEAASMLHPEHSIFSPTIEGRGANSTTEKFLSQHPHEIIKSGNFQKVPWLVGVNSAEGLMYAAPMTRNLTARKELNENWSFWIPIAFRFNRDPRKAEIATAIREHYIGNLTTEEVDETKLPNLINLATHRFFMEGMHNSLLLHKGQHPIYPYFYDYQGQFSFGRILLGMSFNVPIVLDFLYSNSKRWVQRKIFRTKETFHGATHGDELAILFNLPFQDVTEKHPDYEMSQKLVKAWTKFAIHGTPGEVDNITWPDISSKDKEPEPEVDEGFHDDDEVLLEDKSEDNIIELSNNNNSTTTTIPTRKKKASNSLSPQEDKPYDADKPLKWLKISEKMELIDDPFHEEAKFWRSLNLFPEREYNTEQF